MKNIFSILFLFIYSLSFGQVDTLTPEKKARYRINVIKGTKINQLPNYAISNALRDLANLSVKRVPYLTQDELRSGRADTASVVSVINNGRIFSYVYSSVSIAPDDSSMVLVSGNRRYLLNYDILTPAMFGAIGDLVANDTKAIQKCFDKVVANQTINFQGLKYKFDSVTLIKPDVNLIGQGALMQGILKIGNTTNRTYNMQISGFVFDFTGDPIKIRGVRKLALRDNIFKKCNRSIYIVPGPNGQHLNGMIEIGQNVFNDVNYCFYADRLAGASWQTNSDCSFIGNIANNALITAVYANGIDGLKMIDNVIFTPSDNTRRVEKKNHLRIEEQSDWIIVSNNNFFESGEESLWFYNCKGLNVNGNNFAWSGQKGAYHVISLNGVIIDYVVNITGNVFDGFSGDVVHSGPTTYGRVNVSSNTIQYDDTFSGYFGAVYLSMIDHFIVNGENASIASTYLGNNPSAGSTANLKLRQRGTVVKSMIPMSRGTGISYKRSVVVTNGSTPIDIGGLQSTSNTSNYYMGILLVNAKSSDGTTGNNAFVQAIISKPYLTTPVISILNNVGLTTGSNTNHPSFTYTISGDRLFATPVSQTAGTFYIYLQTQGDLSLID